MTATRLVHQLAGAPEPTGAAAKLLKPQAGNCAVCGEHEEITADVNRALGANFTDRSLFRGPRTNRVCKSCLWCCSGRPPATLRMWSIIAAPGEDHGPSHEKAWLQNTPGLLLTNRANPGPIAHILGSPPRGEWVTTVAVSGQKHVLPYGEVNYGTGPWRVRFEDATVTSRPQEWIFVHGHALALRRMGVPADDVMTGTPRYLKTHEELQTWEEHNSALIPYHGAPLLGLALWTITKGTMQNA